MPKSNKLPQFIVPEPVLPGKVNSKINTIIFYLAAVIILAFVLYMFYKFYKMIVDLRSDLEMSVDNINRITDSVNSIKVTQEKKTKIPEPEELLDDIIARGNPPEDQDKNQDVEVVELSSENTDLKALDSIEEVPE